MVYYLKDPRFHLFLKETIGGLFLVWILALFIVLLRKPSWKRNDRIDVGGYNAWITAISLHLLFILTYNSYEVHTWYFRDKEMFTDFWQFLVTYIVGITINVILLVVLISRRNRLKSH